MSSMTSTLNLPIIQVGAPVVEVKPTANLPRPVGWRLLIHIPKKSEKVGSVYMPEETRKTEETATIVGKVVLMGPLAYKDDQKFPTGPWCYLDDFVIFRAYSGTRLIVAGEEYRLLNDDSIEAVVADPSEVQRP